MAQHQEWMSIEEVAAELKISTEAVRKLIETGKVAAVTAGDEVRVRASALDRFARRAERGAAARRWRRGALALGGVAAAALAAVVAIAANPPLPGEVVPRQIPYRGSLELNGASVTNPETLMRFELFTQESGGVAAWSEYQSVSVADGLFTVALGDNPDNQIPSALFAQPSLYLQIAVGGQQLSGRQRLLTVPYAHAADSSDLVRGRDITTWLVPAGAIVAFGGQAPPAGWALCDGRELNRADYPALFAAIGTSWGAPTGWTFNLPDLRGRFLRGADLGAGVDPEAPWRGALKPGGNGGDAAGSAQADATAVNSLTVNEAGLHDHSDGLHEDLVLRNTGGGTESDHDGGSEPDLRTGYPIFDAGAHVHGLSGDAETRPVNAAVNWIIKYE
jgi:excisionase family DNA binding protein